jgi:hypothetical protein
MYATLGTSEKSSTDVQLEQLVIAWGMAAGEQPSAQPLEIRIVGEQSDVAYEL